MSKFKLFILKSAGTDEDQVVKDALAKFNELPGIKAIHLQGDIEYDMVDVDVPVSSKIFYIDTGDSDDERTKEIVEKFKKELNERRVHTSVYNSITQLEDYVIPLSTGKSRSRVEIMRE